MACDYLWVWFFAEKLDCFICDVFVAGSVEAVFSDSVFCVELLRDGVEICFFVECLVECCVKDSDLFCSWE